MALKWAQVSGAGVNFQYAGAKQGAYLGQTHKRSAGRKPVNLFERNIRRQCVPSQLRLNT